MKITTIEKVREAMNSMEAEKVLFFVKNGSGYYKINRMTKHYGNLPLRCKLYQDYETKGDGIFWLMQTCTVIKSNYSAKDLHERKMFDDAVTIEGGAEYLIVDMTKAPASYTAVKVKARVNGDCSDACVFEEL